ncbi:hypothetical protein RHMOL_Rhmol13G0156800 [Rhododendron molle]|uniref:Uncharacterized protein n=1 Tax=Rhododendron molle TaxID=49168 RepID=A0ACC0L751_RHOML|nr:hypothetical protein RHMOL_Rhmol13G0156800 [Rhododendron molle]
MGTIELEGLEKKAKASGASQLVVKDLEEEFAMVDVAREVGTDAVSHAPGREMIKISLLRFCDTITSTTCSLELHRDNEEMLKVTDFKLIFALLFCLIGNEEFVALWSERIKGSSIEDIPPKFAIWQLPNKVFGLVYDLSLEGQISTLCSNPGSENNQNSIGVSFVASGEAQWNLERDWRLSDAFVGPNVLDFSAETCDGGTLVDSHIFGKLVQHKEQVTTLKKSNER